MLHCFGAVRSRVASSASSRWILVVAGLLGTEACGGPAEPRDDSNQSAAFQRILDELAVSKGVVGAQATVLIPNRAAWTGVTGISDETTPMSPGLLVSIGSITKTFVGALMVQLADQGRLGLDDRMDRWLPPIANVPPDVTIRQLLQHTSGLFSYTQAPDFLESVLSDRARVWTPEELLHDFVGPVLFPPGTAWAASQTNFLLLEMIAETVTGQPLGQLLRNRLFTPNGLALTWLGGDGEPPGPQATGWTGQPGGPLQNFTRDYLGPNWHSVERGASGILSTSADIARWGKVLFDGSALGPAATQLLFDFFPDNYTQPAQTGAGLGVRRYDFLGRVEYGHTGVTPHGSGLVLYDVATGITVAVLTNQSAPSHDYAYYDIGEALLRTALGL